MTLTAYLFPCSIQALGNKSGTGLRQKLTIYPDLDHDGVPPRNNANEYAPLVISGEADVDDEDDSAHGFCLSDRFTAWALPIMDFKEVPAYSFARHWGLLLKKNNDGEYVRLGIYRVKDGFMERIVKEGRCTQRDVLLV